MRPPPPSHHPNAQYVPASEQAALTAALSKEGCVPVYMESEMVEARQ